MNDLDYSLACVDSYKMKQEQYKYNKSCELMFNNKQKDLRIYKVFDGKQFNSIIMKRLKINDLIQIYEYLNWSNKSTLYKNEDGYSYFKVIKNPYMKKVKIWDDIEEYWYVDVEGLNEDETMKYMQKYKSNSKYQYTGIKLKEE